MIIDIIAGARPNFMKIAPIIEAIETAKSNGENINYRLVHTGQHYDNKMSGDFFTQLGNSITLVDNRRIIEPGEIIVEPQTTQPRSRLDSADFVQGIYTKERVSAMHRAANEMGGIAVSVVAQPGEE